MALEIGDIGASSGMAETIYLQIQANLEGDLGDMPEEDMEKVRTSWRKLAHAIATGVIGHLLTNLEILGVETQGDVGVTFGGLTQQVNGHQHGPGTLTGTQNNLTFTQSNDGTGRIA